MSDYRDLVRAALRALEIQSPTTYTWFGASPHRLPRAVRQLFTPRTARNFLLYHLQAQLYNDFYTQGRPEPSREEGRPAPALGQSPFVEQLTAANSGSGYWAAGWEVQSSNGDEVVVQNGDLTLWVRSGDLLPPAGQPITRGTSVAVRFPKEFPTLSPGYYMALSDAELTDTASRGLVRLYWNLNPAGALRFLELATRALNDARVAFRLKVLNEPAQYVRCDSAVLYVCKSDYPAVAGVLREVYPQVARSLGRATPTFTKHLAAGVGVAEDPGEGESFGMHRCRILAEAAVLAYEQGKHSLEERLRMVEESFAAEGLSVDRPYLGPNSADLYDLALSRRQLPRPERGLARHRVHPDSSQYLETAAGIGRQLAGDALWHDERCNWLGSTFHERPPRTSSPVSNYRALGPDLYSGTAGIALFLAELYRVTGEDRLRVTAAGAMRHALRLAGSLGPAEALGMYTGSPGIALAAARVGVALGQEEFIGEARRLIAGSVDVLSTTQPSDRNASAMELDFLSGLAGAVAASAILSEAFGDGALLDAASALGNELLRTAQPSAPGLSWRSPSFRRCRNLTGFSHGTAGIAYALLELYHSTGGVEYRQAAEEAFSYERHWFDPEERNWPDFREEERTGKRVRRRHHCSTYWCHGAPGIALSRLRAYELLGDQVYRDEAVVALETTYRAVEGGLAAGTGNYSLCHGHAGNSEVLIHGFQVLGSEWARSEALAHAVGSAGIEIRARSATGWTCGTADETPDLMLGLAGIGLFYLRLSVPEVPSVLIWQRGKV